jgi:hypothetical protein
MGSDRGESKLGIWLGFAGTILAALIGGVFVLLAARGGDQPAPGPQPAAQQTSKATVPSAGPSTGTPSANTQPVSGPATVRWEGNTAIHGGITPNQDLDQIPPRPIEQSSDGDVFTSNIGSDGSPYGYINSGLESKATVAVWTGTGPPPDYAKCRETALAQAVPQAQLRKGNIVCVKTSDGRIARLTVTSINERNVTMTFNTVVWEPTG